MSINPAQIPAMARMREERTMICSIFISEVMSMIIGSDEAALVNGVILLVNHNALACDAMISAVKAHEMENLVRIFALNYEHSRHDDSRGDDSRLALFDTVSGRDNKAGQNGVNVKFSDGVTDNFGSEFGSFFSDFVGHGCDWLTR